MLELDWPQQMLRIFGHPFLGKHVGTCQDSNDSNEGLGHLGLSTSCFGCHRTLAKCKEQQRRESRFKQSHAICTNSTIILSSAEAIRQERCVHHVTHFWAPSQKRAENVDLKSDGWRTFSSCSSSEALEDVGPLASLWLKNQNSLISKSEKGHKSTKQMAPQCTMIQAPAHTSGLRFQRHP